MASAADRKQPVDEVLEAFLASCSKTNASSTLLRRLLQTSAGPQDLVAAQEFQIACTSCSELFMFLNEAACGSDRVKQPGARLAAKAGMQMAAACVQNLKSSFVSLEKQTELHQPLIHVLGTFLHLAKTALLLKGWLQTAGQDLFAATAAVIKSTVKDCAVPLLCFLASHPGNLDSIATPGPYEQLVSIGRLSADVIADKAKLPIELRSFGVLNLAWSSIVKLLIALANIPDPAKIAKRFHVIRLLQLLIGYIKCEFDTMLAQADPNLLKVVRFWAQWVGKLATAFPEVSQGIWGSLAGCFAHIHSNVPPVRDDDRADMQAVYAELQQFLLPRFASIAAACLPATTEAQSSMSPWMHALCNDTKSSSQPHSELASQPVTGRFMLLLDILRNGASLTAAAQLQCARHGLPFAMMAMCAHLSGQACRQRQLRESVVQALLVFMAACSSSRQSTAWQDCELFLFKQAMLPHPMRLACLAQLWQAVLRKGASSLATTHVQMLHQLLLAGATRCPPSMAMQQLHSPAIRQLVQLTAHLVRAAAPQQKAALCDLMLEAAKLMGSASGKAAALAVTFRVLRLASLSSSPAVQPQLALQKLQETIRMAQLTSEDTCHWPMLCLAEMLQYCEQTHVQKSEALIRQSLKLAAGRLAQATANQASAACALQVLVHTHSMCSQQDLQDLLPGLLLLQQDDQAAASVATMAFQYAETRIPHEQLFHALLLEEHWALQYEAMQSLVQYMRIKDGDFKQILPRQLYDPDSLDGESSKAFIKLLKEYMQRTPEAEQLPGAGLAPGCCRLEQQTSKAWQATVQYMTGQAAESDSALQGCLPDMIDSAVVRALQAMEDLSKCLAAGLPGQHAARKAEVQTQLSLLAQVASGCCVL